MALRFSPARGAASFALSTAIRGPVGAAATIAFGTTTTLAAGASATGNNSGSSAAATFNFGIPRGADAGMRYAFESSTSMAAPASGGMRLNNAAIASVTAIAVNAINSDAIDVSDYIATWDDSTSSVKGYVEVRKEGSGSVLGLYRITSVTDNSTWLQFAVTYISGSGTFTAADPVYLMPFRTGDAGTGDFSSNTSTSVDGEMLLFSGTAGKTGKRSTLTGGLLKSTSGVPAIATAGTDYYAPGSTDVVVADGGTGVSSTTAYAVQCGGTTTTGPHQSVAIGTAGRLLMDNGASALPSFTAITSTITFIIDGGGATITTGVKGDLEIPFACTITRATTLADQSGSIVIDIWKDTFANYPPTVADTITASAKPTISATTKAQDSTLTGWNTSIVAGDTLRFNVDSITTCQRVTLSLKVTRTGA